MFGPRGPGAHLKNFLDHPVVHVSYADAMAYAEWAGKELPTEAEWEYAARAGTTTKYAFGDTIDSTQARFTSGQRGAGKTEKVGSFAPNAWGLYDMHGNVWEWVTDCYDNSYDGAPSDGSVLAWTGAMAPWSRSIQARA